MQPNTGFQLYSPMILGVNDHKAPNGAQEEQVTETTLNLLSAFIDGLIEEESLGHQAQILLHRVSMPICLLANCDPQMFVNREHPARQIFESIVKIAKLSGDKFGPGDMLYKTLMESIKTLQSRNINSFACLERVNSDLVHIVKMAYMRAPFEKKQSKAPTGELTEAKITAALLVVRHGNRFAASNTMLYFALTQWLELLVISMLKHGKDNSRMREFDRMTFLLFYLSSKQLDVKRIALAKHLINKTKLLTQSLGNECLGYELNLEILHKKVAKLLEVGAAASPR